MKTRAPFLRWFVHALQIGTVTRIQARSMQGSQLMHYMPAWYAALHNPLIWAELELSSPSALMQRFSVSDTGIVKDKSCGEPKWQKSGDYVI